MDAVEKTEKEYLTGFEEGFMAAMNYLHKEDFPDWKSFVPEDHKELLKDL